MTKGFYFVSLVVLVVSLFTLTSSAQDQPCSIELQADHLNDLVRSADSITDYMGHYRCLNKELTAHEEMLRKIQPPDRTGYSSMRNIVPMANTMIKEAENNIGWAMNKNSTCEKEKEYLQTVKEALDEMLANPAEDFCNNSKPSVQEVRDHVASVEDMVEGAIQDRNTYIGLNQEFIGQANRIKLEAGGMNPNAIGSRAPASIPMPSGF